MCGRIFQTLPLSRLLQIARTKKYSNQDKLSCSYNVMPTTHIPVIKQNRMYREQEKQVLEEEKQDQTELTFMKWGHMSKQKNFVINGRIQQLTLKKMFLNCIENRCVVIMDGYYQWNSKKQPYSFRPKDSDHFLVAALYTQQNQIIILTKDATKQISNVHHRMPVILSHQQVNLWLDPKNTKDINTLIQKSLLNKDKAIWKQIGFAKIAPHVNSSKEKSIKCLMTVEEYKKQLDRNGLMKYWNKPAAVEIVGKNGQIIQDKLKIQIKLNQIQQNPIKKNPIVNKQQKINEIKQKQQENSIKKIQKSQIIEELQKKQ